MAWHSHEYARAFGTGIHVNPSTWDVGHLKEPQVLLARLNASIPGKTLRVRCEGTKLFVDIEGDDFTEGQLTTVVNDIAAQKAVADWPPMVRPCMHSKILSMGEAPAAEAVEILASVSANGNSAPDAQPSYPCNLRCKAASDGGSMDVTVTITGVRADGMADQEVIILDSGDDDYDSERAWASISDIAYTGTWDGADITFSNGPLLGLPNGCCNTVYKEIFDGAPQTVGTFDSTYGTYDPTGTLDGAKLLEVWMTL